MAPTPPARPTKAAILDKALRGMFKKLEARPLPDHITSIVDQLEAAAEAPAGKKRGSGEAA